eukprot:13698467-Heterocapsa_arctica.AAC.1
MESHSRSARTIEAHDRGPANRSASHLEANADYHRGRVPDSLRVASRECRVARADVAAASAEGAAACRRLRWLC